MNYLTQNIGYGYEFYYCSSRLGVIVNPSNKYFKPVLYAGFSDNESALIFHQWLADQGIRSEVRPGKRLGMPVEVKVWGFYKINLLERLVKKEQKRIQDEVKFRLVAMVPRSESFDSIHFEAIA